MLERLLQTLRDGGTHTLSGLARELEVSEPLVEMMMEQLATMGQVQAESGNCTDHCDGCHMMGPCVTGGATRSWTLTPRG